MAQQQKHSPDIIEQIRIWWATGEYSAEQIGKAVGLNKNQVIGQIYRGRERDGEVRWRRSAPGKSVPRGAFSGVGKALPPIKPKPVVKTPKPAKPVKAAPEPFEARRIRFVDRSLRDCAYVLGEVDGENTICCGSRVEEGFSWCSYHLERVTDKRPRRRAEAA